MIGLPRALMNRCSSRFQALPGLAIPMVFSVLLLNACAQPSSPVAIESSSGEESGTIDNDDEKDSPSGDSGSSQGRRSMRGERPSGDRILIGPLATVTRVIDGDTIEVSLRGRTVDVRLIGVDTPETVHPSEPVECFGPEASSFTSSRLSGERVRLEFDVERTDRYGRTLAYVWLDDKLFNRMLVRQGFAQVSIYPPNVKYVERFTAAQRAARESNAGLWGATCPSREEEETAQPAPGSGGGKNCDPNYTGACIPPYPPDLDCTEISATNFNSVGSDPHGLDGDGDGVACET